VPVCTLCRRKPSTVFCRADAAFLCGGCDAEAHAAPLAARHTRIPAAEAVAASNGCCAGSAECVSESTNTAAPAAMEQQAQQQAAAASAAMTVGAVPPAVDLPANHVMDKDALAKSLFGKDMEVRGAWGGWGGWRGWVRGDRSCMQWPAPHHTTTHTTTRTTTHTHTHPSLRRRAHQHTTRAGLCAGQQLAGPPRHGL
jgi:hypothetical protein